MFGQSVLAELPDSMRAQSPNETRSIEASFVHSDLDTGPVVQGALRIDGELVLKRFVARNLRPITPIAWNQIIGDQLFSEIASGAEGDVPAVDEPGGPAALPPPKLRLQDLKDLQGLHRQFDCKCLTFLCMNELWNILTELLVIW
eukprot:s5888_g3.t1